MALGLIAGGLIVAIFLTNTLNAKKEEKEQTIVYDYRTNPEVFDELFNKN